MHYSPNLAGSLPAALPLADPHPTLWADWQRLRNLRNGPEVIAGSLEGKAARREMERLGHLLCSTVAFTGEGLAAQFEYLTTGMQDDDCDAVVEIVVPALDAFLAELDGLDEF